MSQPSRQSVRSPLSEAIDARFLRSMLYEPLPGSAAHILAQLGIIEQGHVEALGARTYDAEQGRLSLSLDDGRTVELERAMPLQSEDGYAVRIRSRAGQTISRSFIHIDRNLVVRNLHNDRTALIDDPYGEPTHRTYAPTYNQPMDTMVDVDLPPAQSMDGVDEAMDRAMGVDALAEDPNPDLTLPELSALQAEEAEVSAQPQVELAAHAAPEPVESYPESNETPGYQGEIQDPATQIPPIPAAIPSPLADPLEDHGPIYFQEAPQNIAPQPAWESLELLSEPDEPDQAPSLLILEEQESTDLGQPLPEALVAAVEPKTELVSEAFEPDEPAYFAEPEAAEEWLTLEPAQPIELTGPFFTESEPVLGAPEQVSATSEAALEHEPEPVPAEEDVSADDYAPLVAVFGAETAADFSFIALTGTVHTYEHNQTFRYIHLDGLSGLFYSQDRTPISAAAALQYALTPRISSKQPEVELAAPASVLAHPPEPELRTRTSPAPRAAIRPDPDPSDLKPDQALTFDAFTRKHHLQHERDSWRNRIADLSRTLRLRRSQAPEKPLDEL
jgi:hypothetical protein